MAIAAILERLPASARGTVLIEVPEAGDALDLAAPAGVQVNWYFRDGGRHGDLLVPAVRAAAGDLPRAAAPVDPPADGDDEVWDVPQGADSTGDGYGWLAGESATIRTLRRHLVSERGHDRRRVALLAARGCGPLRLSTSVVSPDSNR